MKVARPVRRGALGKAPHGELAWCLPYCHNTYDAPKRRANRNHRQLRQAGQLHFDQLPPPLP